MTCWINPFWGSIAWSVLRADTFGWYLSLVFCMGRMPCLVLEPWIGFSGPGKEFRTSLRISLMLYNYIKFQNWK